MILEKKVIKDPIHNYIYINPEDDIIWKLINTPEFQRLRRIKQLSGADMTFPSATHTRFNHSLGVYELARKAILELNLTKSNLERTAFLCAALLHDIGHGPFSHTFEVLFNLDHEYYSQEIIKNSKTNINKILKEYDSKLPSEICKIIGKKHKNKALISLITSQIDLDRMDYFSRDSYFCGLGLNLDIPRLFRMMEVDNNKIVFKKSALFQIENFLMSRYHLFEQIYLHPNNIGYEFLLLSFVKRFAYLLNSKFLFKYDYEKLNYFISSKIKIENYLDFDEIDFMFYIKQAQKEKDLILKDIASRIINRELFKYTIYNEDEGFITKKALLEDFCLNENLDPDYYIFTDELVQKSYYTSKYPILIKHQNKIVEVTEYSSVIKAINKSNSNIVRVFYPNELFTNLSNSKKIQLNKILGIN